MGNSFLIICLIFDFYYPSFENAVYAAAWAAAYAESVLSYVKTRKAGYIKRSGCLNGPMRAGRPYLLLMRSVRPASGAFCSETRLDRCLHLKKRLLRKKSQLLSVCEFHRSLSCSTPLRSPKKRSPNLVFVLVSTTCCKFAACLDNLFALWVLISMEP